MRLKKNITKASDQKFIFIIFEQSRKIKIEEEYSIDGTIYNYKCHVKERKPSGEYETHFLHKEDLVYDFNGFTDFSYNSNHDNSVKMILLSRKNKSKCIKVTQFIYNQNAIRTIRRKSNAMSDKTIRKDMVRKRLEKEALLQNIEAKRSKSLKGEDFDQNQDFMDEIMEKRGKRKLEEK